MFKNKQKELQKAFLKYFHVDYADGITSAYGDIADEDLKTWLYAVTTAIQKSFSKHEAIKNYLVGEFIIGGQKIEFAFVKEFKTGPHAMRLKAEEENILLKKEIERLQKLVTRYEND